MERRRRSVFGGGVRGLRFSAAGRAASGYAKAPRHDYRRQSLSGGVAILSGAARRLLDEAPEHLGPFMKVVLGWTRTGAGCVTPAKKHTSRVPRQVSNRQV